MKKKDKIFILSTPMSKPNSFVTIGYTTRNDLPVVEIDTDAPEWVPDKGGKEFIPMEGVLYVHQGLKSILEAIDDAKHKFNLEVENFIAKYGEENYKKACVAASSLNYHVSDIMALFEKFHGDQQRKKEIADNFATLSNRRYYPVTVTDTGWLKLEKQDRIPVPKKYKRNRFKK